MYKAEKLYEGFIFPKSYLALIECGLQDFVNWYIWKPEESEERLLGVSKRYPNRKLIPFARCNSTDDIACFEYGKGDTVVVIHDFAGVGWENSREYIDVWDWLHSVIDEMKDYI